MSVKVWVTKYSMYDLPLQQMYLSLWLLFIDLLLLFSPRIRPFDLDTYTRLVCYWKCKCHWCYEKFHWLLLPCVKYHMAGPFGAKEEREKRKRGRRKADQWLWWRKNSLSPASLSRQNRSRGRDRRKSSHDSHTTQAAASTATGPLPRLMTDLLYLSSSPRVLALSLLSLSSPCPPLQGDNCGNWAVSLILGASFTHSGTERKHRQLKVNWSVPFRHNRQSLIGFLSFFSFSSVSFAARVLACLHRWTTQQLAGERLNCQWEGEEGKFNMKWSFVALSDSNCIRVFALTYCKTNQLWKTVLSR